MREISKLWPDADPLQQVRLIRSAQEYSEWLRRESSFPSEASGGLTPPVLKFADLFCGPGGFSYGVREGLSQGGILGSAELGIDLSAPALDTYKRNLRPSAIRSTDIGALFPYPLRGVEERLLAGRSVQTTDSSVLMKLRKCALVIASPPCRGFSNLNNHSRRNDDRNDLAIAAATLSILAGADHFCMENVPEVRRDKGGVLPRMSNLFKMHGYRIAEVVVNAESFGVPQSRKRLFFFASKTLDSERILEDFSSTEIEPPRLFDALNVPFAESSEPHMHSPASLSEENWRRVRFLFENDLYELPDKERPDCHKDGHTYPSVYGRLYPHSSAGTLTSGFLSPGRGRYVHPVQARGLTLREGARIQSFPDCYQFDSSLGKTKIAQLIGDAVAPKVSFHLGIAIANALSDQSRT